MLFSHDRYELVRWAYARLRSLPRVEPAEQDTIAEFLVLVANYNDPDIERIAAASRTLLGLDKSTTTTPPKETKPSHQKAFALVVQRALKNTPLPPVQKGAGKVLKREREARRTVKSFGCGHGML